MNIGVVKYNYPAPLDALAEGIKAAGDTVTTQHINTSWSDSDYGGDYDAIMVWGWSKDVQHVVNLYAERGIPCITVELGHIGRGEYFQTGINQINWLPREGDTDRMLDILSKETITAEPTRGEYVVICGQKPGDAQHNIDDMNQWRIDTLAEVRKHTDRPVVWRQHPHDLTQKCVVGFDAMHHPRDVSLQKTLKQAWCLVTHNSNIGIQAMLNGVPVICHESCWYGAGASTRLSDIDTIELNPALPDILARVAYAQWSLNEMRSGDAWRFLRPYVQEAIECHKH